MERSVSVSSHRNFRDHLGWKFAVPHLTTRVVLYWDQSFQLQPVRVDTAGVSQ